MFIGRHYSLWFSIALVCQFTIQCNTMVPNTYFSKTITMFQAMPGNTGVKFAEKYKTGVILYMRSNERRRYIVTSSLIGWAHAQYTKEIYRSSYQLEFGSILAHRRLTTRHLSPKFIWSNTSADACLAVLWLITWQWLWWQLFSGYTRTNRP